MAKTVLTETIDGFRVSLTNTGKLYVAYGRSPLVQRHWYANPVSRAPWIPKKCNFVALMRVRIRNGDFDDIKAISQQPAQEAPSGDAQPGDAQPVLV